MHRSLRRLALATALIMIGTISAAQTTHTVMLSGISFSPDDLTIAVGDTVDWVWSSGLHNVESGVGGVPDGFFSSGAPQNPPRTFSVTFDQAFLDANPTAGKAYDYYCIVHLGLGMTGRVTVEVPSQTASRNGGTNPASLGLGGQPSIGTSMILTVDLTTTGHSQAAVFGFDTSFNFTLSGGQTLLCLDLGGSGELLFQAPQPGPVAAFSIPVPNNPAFCGFELCVQAIHFGGVVPFALSDAIDMTVGNS